MQTLELNNVGPVSHLSIPVPEGGGVVVLRGYNGAGKTETLKAIDAAFSGRGKLNVKDGRKNCEFSGLGITVKVSSRTTRTGKLEVESLEGKLSIAELVDPGIDKADSADAVRIKALVQLSNVLPAVELFTPIFGNRDVMNAAVSLDSLKEIKDLVTMADRIKRDCHKKAKAAEDEAEKATTHARGARNSADGIDVSVETDAVTLQAQLNSAVREEERLKAAADSANKAMETAIIAGRKLEEAESQHLGLSVSMCQASEDHARSLQVAAEETVRTITGNLQQQKHDAELASQQLTSCSLAASRAAKDHEGKANKCAGTRATIANLEHQLAIARQQMEADEADLQVSETTVATRNEEVAVAKTAYETALDSFRKTEALHTDAKRANDLASQAVENGVSARKAAEAHEAAMSKWREQISAGQLVAPSAELLEEAAAEVRRCNKAIDQAARARVGKQFLSEAARYETAAREYAEEADKFRNFAKGTDDVLSDVVAQTSKQLRVEAGRLVLDTERGVTYFGDLSHGQRWKMALDIAIEQLGPRGVMMIPQEAWEGLQPKNRQLIVDHVRGRHVTILTAASSDDEEIVAEVLA